MKGLVLYVSTGHGFKSPAVAIAKALEARGHEIVTADLFAEIGAMGTHNLLTKSWSGMLARPFLFRLVFPVMNSILVHIAQFLDSFLVRRKVFDYVDRIQPDFIISTHFTSTAAIGYQRRAYEKHSGRRPAFFAYNSDVILSHHAYLNHNVDKYFVSTQRGLEAMVKQGMPRRKLVLVEFPLDEKFSKRFRTVSEERAALGLKDMFTCLVSLGGEGVGDLSFIRRVAERGVPAQLVVICGRNQAAAQALEALKVEHPHFELVVRGFVANMQDYLYCCDIAAGKAGLNTIFEGMAMRKPFLILMAMANELHAAEFVVEEGFGFHPRKGRTGAVDPDEAAAILERAVRGDSTLSAIAARLDLAPYRFGTDGIVKTIDNVLRQREAAMELRKAKALFFDMAGTLCDIPIGDKWEQVTRDGILRVMDKAGLGAVFTREELDAWAERFVSDKARLRKEAKKTLQEFEIKGQLAEFLALVGKENERARVVIEAAALDDRAYRELERAFISTELEITIPFPETLDVLTKLSKRYDLFMLSNNVSEVLCDEINGKMQVGRLFKQVFVSCKFGYRKPHRAFMDGVLTATKLDPKDCVMIGDRLGQDIVMANDYGMPTIYCAMVDHEDNDGVGHVPYTVKIEALHELVDILL